MGRTGRTRHTKHAIDRGRGTHCAQHTDCPIRRSVATVYSPTGHSFLFPHGEWCWLGSSIGCSVRLPDRRRRSFYGASDRLACSPFLVPSPGCVCVCYLIPRANCLLEPCGRTRLLVCCFCYVSSLYTKRTTPTQTRGY